MSIKTIIVSLLVLLFLLYLVIGLALYFFQEKLIFYPTKISKDYNFPHFEDASERYYPVDENSSIHALYFKAKSTKGVVLYFHGNARALDSWGYMASDFTKLGYDVLMPDYRSYGKSEGKLSETAFHQDALFLYEDLQKDFAEKDIIIYGRSLGSGIACRLATSVHPRLLIMETPYLSLDAMARKMTRLFPINSLLQYHFRNDENIKQLNCPVHVFHGTNDNLIPYEQAVELANIYGEKQILTTIKNGGHNNLPEFEKFQEKLEQLLSP